MFLAALISELCKEETVNSTVWLDLLDKAVQLRLDLLDKAVLLRLDLLDKAVQLRLDLLDKAVLLRLDLLDKAVQFLFWPSVINETMFVSCSFD